MVYRPFYVAWIKTYRIQLYIYGPLKRIHSISSIYQIDIDGDTHVLKYVINIYIYIDIRYRIHIYIYAYRSRKEDLCVTNIFGCLCCVAMAHNVLQPGHNRDAMGCITRKTHLGCGLALGRCL